jgi:transposase
MPRRISIEPHLSIDELENRFIFMPSYSPELQPAERLWPVSNEAIAPLVL